MMKTCCIKKVIVLTNCLLVMVGMHAQSVKRQCVSSYGAIMSMGNIVFEQTVGQPYCTSVSNETEVALLPGYQQPVNLSADIVYPNILSSMNLSVFPNPATTSLTLHSNVLLEKPVINVTDMNGKVILSEQPAQMQTHTVNCTAWHNGVYLLTIRDEQQNSSVIKLIINK